MSLFKVVELVGSSSDNWTEAVGSAVEEASKTLPNITGVEVTNFTAVVQSGQLKEYRANVKIAYSESKKGNV